MPSSREDIAPHCDFSPLLFRANLKNLISKHLANEIGSDEEASRKDHSLIRANGRIVRNSSEAVAAKDLWGRNSGSAARRPPAYSLLPSPEVCGGNASGENEH